MENNKQEQIHTKGFDITKYGKTKIGGKVVNDPTVIISPKETNNQRLNHKSTVLKALADQDLDTLRELSQYFYRTNGIYQKVLNYLATMYRYDWYLVPEVYGDNVKSEEIVTNFNHILNYLDNSYIKKLCGDIALNVVRDGAYYGYIVENPTGIVLQDLPIGYCRSRFNINGLPAVEFNMRFFDEQFPNAQYRLKVLKMFPKEFSVGYLLYKQGKLPADNVSLFENSCGSWYLLEPNSTVKFSLNKADIPVMVNAIPEIIDLDSAQELDRRKQLQKLLKIIVQKLPLDKNGELIFDVDEAYDIHKNAVEMLRNAIGVDVLTTFTDVDSVDISDKSTSTSKDDLEKVERAVFNAMGLSKNIFNTDGNLSLEKSILNDEGSVRNLLLQFAIFFDKIVQKIKKKDFCAKSKNQKLCDNCDFRHFCKK